MQKCILLNIHLHRNARVIFHLKNIYYLRLRTYLDGGGIGCEGSRTVIPPSTNITTVQASSLSLSDGVKLSSVVDGNSIVWAHCSLSSQVLGNVRTEDVFALFEHSHLLNCCCPAPVGTTVRFSKCSWSGREKRWLCIE